MMASIVVGLMVGLAFLGGYWYGHREGRRAMFYEIARTPRQSIRDLL